MTDPMADLHDRRRENFAGLVEGGKARLDALFATVPALGELAVGTVYGHLHERPALDARTREAATLAAIVAAGMVGPPLSVHLRTGLASVAEGGLRSGRPDGGVRGLPARRFRRRPAEPALRRPRPADPAPAVAA
ncbi:hypothetical protein AMES_6031 [Amycolatopsis mediterranei S699]|uniref:Carboxymuconolactone decarboxylase n=2 Tax=Amycolatopsis mediterranei TaxID=33910 RepID=A0A0H3DB36_AMYMU|nr:hypothetical protein [Amycolatopsis mediterranei]ADJ47856.1 conserved hypothetical protein [Amycolatopsis mediterranei U32]AEK44748.1 hypothetical protein RAM_31365 [Amycolatopsis mediterranei S699]AFO79567.1 hypothetical protein AMES_6031 [Amycolatopsis mediterranei S699]AGT86695.1 hypothetical protein B737_6031 [Amycolatopsis mediterranei RB]KDO10339.1 hypothetical protein DV26_13140 [Amycolatopsis mediterranei]